MRRPHPRQLRRVGHRGAYRSNFGRHRSTYFTSRIAGLVLSVAVLSTGGSLAEQRQRTSIQTALAKQLLAPEYGHADVS
jgi:hypothetical protein